MITKNQFTQALRKMEEAWFAQGNVVTAIPPAKARGHLDSTIRRDKMSSILRQVT